ncbi:PHB depolymerase family esterase [Polaromonas sp.]|uniref:extracellular catalytic domain type 1 short-chain-length polyhydroxyalkanoate depolymerase n=1 Tax=Polaromonas sp. TaxID=1869339 RepID=UPI00286C599E|nr:PHB depolymerase family esterase [Polaromonas sp.]
MAKSLSSLWLKNLRRLNRTQQTQGRKLLKSLLPKAPRAPAARRVKAVRKAAPVKAAKPLKTVRPLKHRLTAPAASAAPAQPAAGLPGVWKQSWFAVPAAGPVAPARRLLYWLYLPSAASRAASAPLPLVVMLHGCQQTAADFAASTRMNRLAERKGFAVLYPQQSGTADAHRCWHWYQRSTQQGLGEVRQIAQLVAQLQGRHALDASRTYVAGLSAGAALAGLLALHHPGLFAAAGLHSAPVLGTTDSALGAYRAMQHGAGLAHGEAARAFVKALPQSAGAQGMPAILIHGARDAVVRRINMQQLTGQFVIVNQAALAQTEPVLRNYPGRAGGRHPRHAYQSATYYAGRKPQLMRCEIAGLGHAWSGGDGGLAFSAPEGPDATLMMWSFFSRHRREPVPGSG